MAKVLVTGGTGFIGQHLLRALRDRGDQVHCLVRGPRPLPPGVVGVPGDICRPDSLAAALAGIEVVYHLAGATGVRHPLEYRRINAQGTRYLAEACAARKDPPTVVYLSSLAAAGPAPAGRPRDESDPPAPVSHYGWSKLAGERWLATVSRRVPITIVRGSAVFGPGDDDTVRLFRVARLGLNAVPGSTTVRSAWIYVDDMVRALLAAARCGERLVPGDPARGVYFAALDHQPDLQELSTLVSAAVGRPLRTVGLPRWYCLFWGHVIDMWVSITGQPRLLTTDKIREILAGTWTCRTERAQREIGFRCEVGLADGFARTVAWYRAHGWL